MLPPEQPDRIQIAFDDHRLVANAGPFAFPYPETTKPGGGASGTRDGGMVVSLISAVSVDLSGREMAGTGSGVLELLRGAQGVVFSVLLDMTGSPWSIVFPTMAATRLTSGR